LESTLLGSSPDLHDHVTETTGSQASQDTRASRNLWATQHGREEFGYGYDIDPAQHDGMAVEKSDVNGRVHGWLVRCPRQPRPRMVYSRFLEGSEYRIQFFRRLMCVTEVFRDKIDGFPVNWRRPGSSRHNIVPTDHFSARELAQIGRMAQKAGMDYGAMDVIRDRDGKIYVIDMNPGPGPHYQRAFPPEDWPKVLPVEAELFGEAFLP